MGNIVEENEGTPKEVCVPETENGARAAEDNQIISKEQQQGPSSSLGFSLEENNDHTTTGGKIDALEDAPSVAYSSGHFSVRQSLALSAGSVAELGRELAETRVTKPSLLGSWQCSAIVVNYISAGYILLPHAFASAGYLFATFIFALVALQSYITSLFILETCARAESGQWLSSGGSLPLRYSMAIRDTTHEISALHHLFLGSRWANFFLATTVCDLYSITWLLTAVFGHAVAAQVPISGVGDDYKFWVGIFMLITVPLSCTSIVDQLLLQFIFLGGRMLMVVFMSCTVVAAFIAGNESNHFGAQVGPNNDTPMVDLRQTMTIIQTAIFATAFQFSVPSMAGISANKKSMTRIFQRAVTFVYVSNCALALLIALYFGTSTNPSSNLNWAEYHAGSSGWSQFVSGYVVLFAALDGLAVFPLVCTTLGGILLAGVFGDKAPLLEGNYKVQLFFRLLASIPQSIGALYLSDLGEVALFGGIFTLLSYTTAPTLLYIASGRKMKEQGLSERTFYSSKYFSHEWVAYGLLATTVLVIVGVVVDVSLRNTRTLSKT